MSSLIPLLEPAGPPPRITQLYQDLELFSEGDPPVNSIFVLGRADDAAPDAEGDQLLIIDPPNDVASRFRLTQETAVLFTGESVETELPVVESVTGAASHIRVGRHFMDIYVQPVGAIVYFPAVGVVAAGDYGSDALPPRLVPGSDGSDELEALRLLARFIKGDAFQLFVPHVGSISGEKPVIMERLANDVAYLHGLRRVVPGLVKRGEPLETVERIAESLLPAHLQSERALEVHEANLRILTGQE